MHIEAKALDRILSSMPLFSGLSPECLAVLAGSTRMLSFGRGETVFRKGDSADGFYYVFDGKVKLFFVSERGNEKVIEILTPGLTFGEAVMFIDKPYPVYAETMSESHLLYIQREGLMEAMARHEQMSRRLLAGLSRRLHGLITAMEAVCVQSSRERVIGYLLSEMERSGGSSMELPATKVAVASMLNITPETFSRILHGLEKEGLLSIDRRRIRALDQKRLREYAGC
jgi:CRP-like cAMP-binding protein